jgi:hypothetical protein
MLTRQNGQVELFVKLSQTFAFKPSYQAGDASVTERSWERQPVDMTPPES